MPHHYNPGVYDTHDELIVIHAVFACLVAFFLLPIALLVGRYYRRHSVWFRIHAYINALNVCIMSVVFALGTRATQPPGHAQQFVGAHSDTHHRFGLVTFLLFALQGFFGLLSHYTTTGTPPGSPIEGKAAPFRPFFTRGKSIVRYIHVFCGIVIAGVLFGCIYSGFHEWTKSSDNGTATPTGVRVIFWVMLGIWIIVYGAGFVLEYRRRDKSVAMNEKEIETPQ